MSHGFKSGEFDDAVAVYVEPIIFKQKDVYVL